MSPNMQGQVMELSLSSTKISQAASGKLVISSLSPPQIDSFSNDCDLQRLQELLLWPSRCHGCVNAGTSAAGGLLVSQPVPMETVGSLPIFHKEVERRMSLYG